MKGSNLANNQSNLISSAIAQFRQQIFAYYQKNARDFPWRQTRNPYHIVVSEIMLQQTQADRVLPKYLHFLERVSTWHDLAILDTAELLQLWQGLGYNRRALNLQRTAQIVVHEYQGILPQETEQLRSLPGIGPYTAGAIQAFAFNLPVVFIETNIRRVYLHAFFPDQEGVSDQQLVPYLEATLDRQHPRDWYYALMDYGSWLAKQLPNPNRRSRHYTVQSKFEGSRRQLRGYLVRKFVQEGTTPSPAAVAEERGINPQEVERAISELREEGFPI